MRRVYTQYTYLVSEDIRNMEKACGEAPKRYQNGYPNHQNINKMTPQIDPKSIKNRGYVADALLERPGAAKVTPARLVLCVCPGLLPPLGRFGEAFGVQPGAKGSQNPPFR